MPSHKGKIPHRTSQASPETDGLRPDTGLTPHEQDQAKNLVKRIIGSRRDKLPPKTKLSATSKREVYAEVAGIMSADCGRPILARQIELIAMTAKARRTKPEDFTVRLFDWHHALIEAEANTEGVYMRDINARALDAYFGLDPRGTSL